MIEPQSQDARTWAMICHLSALAGLIGIPFGNVLGPLLVWLIKGKENTFIDDQGKEALNFQISMTIYLIVCGLLIFLLIGFPLLIIVALADLILTIIAGIAANNGQTYRYPMNFRFIK